MKKTVFSTGLDAAAVLRGLSFMDAYDVQARFAPVVFAVLPLVLLAIGVIPGLGQMKIAGGTIAALLLVMLPFVATRVARSAGRARQNALYTAWGGMPTTAMLRYRDSRLNPQTKRVFRDRLARLGPSFPLSDEEQEQHDPNEADVRIGAAIDEIRRRAKERGVKAVHRENINYGAARNAYGLKPFGLALCLISLVALATIVGLRGGFVPTPLEIVLTLAVAAIASVWIFVCTGDNVRHHGEAYAQALFEAIDTVVPPTRVSRRSGNVH
jgi:hypothetical protein